MIMQVPTIRFSSVEPEEFVELWSPLYEDENEGLYSDNIGRLLTPCRVRNLYRWKNGGQRLAEHKRQSVERNVIGRLGELRRLREDCPPTDFLLRFGRVGPIWSIFLLHIWQPGTYPIYDRHTHRAMRFILRLPMEELPSGPAVVRRSYVESYIPFFNGFPRLPNRKVDKALFAFGKFLKSPVGRCALTVEGGQRL
jgi:hypothetical protein